VTVLGLKTRIGVFGGTFDPPQNGHVAVASEVLERLSLDLVLFIPAGNPWHKAEEASAEHRAQMVSLAIEGNPHFALSTIDIDRGGPTYSVDTLRDLSHIYPDAQLFFIMGDDAFAGIEGWKDYEDLASLATLVVVSRHGTHPKVPAKLSPSVNLLQIPMLPISSTQCRERIAQELPIVGLVPDNVADYVKDHQLYRRIT
jgi:nicotinate-nucleotide adenylyltransferase